MLDLTPTFSDLLKKGESHNWRYIIKIEQENDDHVNMIANPGFETLDGAHDFADWTEVENNNGKVEAETSVVHSGSKSMKCTEGAGGAPQSGYAYTANIVTTHNTDYVWTFYDKGDGTNAGKYRIYDISNAADITAEASLANTTTGWKKRVELFTTPANCLLVRLYQLSKVGTAGAVTYFDDNHLQPVSDYYYYSGQRFSITDLTTDDLVLPYLQNADIPIKQMFDYRNLKATIGGFSINLIDEGVNDAWASDPIFNRRIWIYLGTDDLDYLDDHLLLYTGTCRNWTTKDKIITLNIENDTHRFQKEIPPFVTSSDAASGQGGKLPSDSDGKVTPIKFGNQNYDIADEYLRNSLMSPAVFLGSDQDGDERWLLSSHVMGALEADQIWGYDPGLNRLVELSAHVVEQNDSSGCIISVAVDEDYYDYWFPDGTISGQVINDNDGAASIGADTTCCNRNNANSAGFEVTDGNTGGGLPTATQDVDFAAYKNSGTISSIDIFARTRFTSDDAVPTAHAQATINGQDAENLEAPPAVAWYQYGDEAAVTEAKVSESVDITLYGADNNPAFDTHNLNVYMMYKRIIYKPKERLQLYVGGVCREFSGLWNDRKVTGDEILTFPDAIESILRDDLGLGDDNIDMDAFDAVNTELTASHLILGSIIERVNSLDLIQNLARQCKSVVFWNADNKVTMDTFFAANTTVRTLDKREIEGLPVVTQSKLSDIVNDFTLVYKKDLLRNKLVNNLNRVDDRGAGSQVKYNAVLTKDEKADFIGDSTTAGLLADHWCKNDDDSFWSVIHDVISITIPTNRGIDFWDTTFKPLLLLELFDIIELDDADYDSILKCNGVSWSGLQFKIFDIERHKLGMKIKAFSV